MINILRINFADNNFPNVGSMAIDKDGSVILLSRDISKLNGILTRSTIVGTYGAEFPYQSGDVAVVPDATRIFMYESSSDTWYELG